VTVPCLRISRSQSLPACKLLLLFFTLVAAAQAEQPIRSNEGGRGLPPVATLSTLAKPSGYVFLGTVLSVKHNAAAGATGIASTEITFQVNEAIRGVHKGEHVTIREWAALWQGGERYEPGEQVALFLYPPSKLGFTSPVGGDLGRFRVDSTSHIIIEPARRALLRPSSNRETGHIPWAEFARELEEDK